MYILKIQQEEEGTDESADKESNMVNPHLHLEERAQCKPRMAAFIFVIIPDYQFVASAILSAGGWHWW